MRHWSVLTMMCHCVGCVLKSLLELNYKDKNMKCVCPALLSLRSTVCNRVFLLSSVTINLNLFSCPSKQQIICWAKINVRDILAPQTSWCGYVQSEWGCWCGSDRWMNVLVFTFKPSTLWNQIHLDMEGVVKWCHHLTFHVLPSLPCTPCITITSRYVSTGKHCLGLSSFYLCIVQ